jgi:signal transduction histidine kinase
MTFLTVCFSAEDPIKRDAVSRIESRFRQMSENINEIFWVTRRWSPEFRLEKSEFSAMKVIEQAVRLSSMVASESKISLVSEISSERPLYADYDKLLQVLINLISNAIKFSKPSGTVVIKATDGDSNCVHFSVKDDGPGIKREDIPKLFRRFMQLNQSDSHTKGGTGLGLAISKAIVEEHQGQIGVLTEDLQGAEFWFDIPCIDQSPAHSN